MNISRVIFDIIIEWTYDTSHFEHSVFDDEKHLQAVCLIYDAHTGRIISLLSEKVPFNKMCQQANCLKFDVDIGMKFF